MISSRDQIHVIRCNGDRVRGCPVRVCGVRDFSVTLYFDVLGTVIFTSQQFHIFVWSRNCELRTEDATRLVSTDAGDARRCLPCVWDPFTRDARETESTIYVTTVRTRDSRDGRRTRRRGPDAGPDARALSYIKHKRKAAPTSRRDAKRDRMRSLSRGRVPGRSG